MIVKLRTNDGVTFVAKFDGKNGDAFEASALIYRKRFFFFRMIKDGEGVFEEGSIVAVSDTDLIES